MKNQLKKIFGDKDSSSSSFDKLEIKSELAFETEHDVLYGQNCGKFFFPEVKIMEIGEVHVVV